MSGLTATDGKTDDVGLPTAMNPAITDGTTGAAIASGVCAALFARERTGQNQEAEGSLLATALPDLGEDAYAISTAAQRAVPAPGERTDEVPASLGFGPGDVAGRRQRGVVR